MKRTPKAKPADDIEIRHRSERGSSKSTIDPLTLKILTILMKKNSSNFVSYVSLKNFLAHVTEVDSRTDTNADQKSEKLTSRRRFFKPSKKSRTKLFPSFANIQNPECNRKSQIEEQEANIFLSSSSRICPDLEENSLIPDIIFSSDGMYEPVEADEVSGFTIYTNSYVFKLYESLRKESSFITISKDKCNNGFTLFHLIPLNTNKMKGNFRFCPFASFTVIMISVEGTSVFILKPQTESYNVLKNLSRITMCPLIKTKNCVAYRPEIYEDNLLSLLKHENHTINSAVVLEFFSGQTLEEELLMNEGLNKKFKKFCELIDRHSKFSCKRNEKLQVDEKEATVAKIRSNEEKVMQSDTNKRISVKLDNMACGSLSNESPGEKYSYNIIPRLVNGSAQAKKHSEKLKEMIFRLKRTVGNSFVTIIFDHREFKNHSEDPPEHVIDFDPNIFASNVQSLFIIVAESQENCELYDVCAKFASHVYYRSDIIEEIFPPIKNCSRNRLMALLDNWVNNSNVLYKMNIRIRKTIHSHRKVLLQRLFESYKKNLEDTIKFDSISTIKINTSYSPLFPTLFLIHNENHKSGNSVASLLIISQNYLIINAIGSSYDRGIVFKRACLKSYNIIDSNIIMIVTKHGNIIQFCIQSSYNKIEKLKRILTNDLNLDRCEFHSLLSNFDELKPYQNVKNSLVVPNQDSDYGLELAKGEIFIKMIYKNWFYFWKFDSTDVCDHFCRQNNHTVEAAAEVSGGSKNNNSEVEHTRGFRLKLKSNRYQIGTFMIIKEFEDWNIVFESKM